MSKAIKCRDSNPDALDMRSKDHTRSPPIDNNVWPNWTTVTCRLGKSLNATSACLPSVNFLHNYHLQENRSWAFALKEIFNENEKGP